jgi:hypothetical protein
MLSRTSGRLAQHLPPSTDGRPQNAGAGALLSASCARASGHETNSSAIATERRRATGVGRGGQGRRLRRRGGVMQRILFNLFNGPMWRAFLMMGVFGGLSAITSYNLVVLFVANLGFISQYGVMALREGGLVQLAELVVYGYLSIGSYILFKGCLYGLLGRFLKH